MSETRPNQSIMSSLLDLPVYCIAPQVWVVLLELKTLWCVPAVLLRAVTRWGCANATGFCALQGHDNADTLLLGHSGHLPECC